MISGSGKNQGSSIPEECFTATNLTQIWRTANRGGGINGGGPHSENGNACDLHSDMQWFRFTGLAGIT